LLCRAFIQAHINAQVDIVRFFSFGPDGSVVTSEMARVILDSQTEIYKASAMAAEEADAVDPQILDGMALLRENMLVTGRLSRFMYDAHEIGVIGGREAETITHPLQEHARIFQKNMRRTMDGRLTRPDQACGDDEDGQRNTESSSQISHKAVAADKTLEVRCDPVAADKILEGGSPPAVQQSPVAFEDELQILSAPGSPPLPSACQPPTVPVPESPPCMIQVAPLLDVPGRIQDDDIEALRLE